LQWEKIKLKHFQEATTASSGIPASVANGPSLLLYLVYDVQMGQTVQLGKTTN
jgi:hypothetical protein